MSSKENSIELDGIKFKCFSLIEFSSLVELLKLLAKKYKTFDDKISNLDERMIEKDKRISELEIMLKGASQSNEDKLKSLVNDEKEKEKEKDIEENKEDKSLIISENNYQSQKVLENEKGKDKEKEEDKDINIDKNKNEPKGSLSYMNLSQLNEKKENEDEKNGEIKDLDEENPIIFDQNNTLPENINQNKKFSTGVHIEPEELNNIQGEPNKELFSKILKKLKAHEKQINDLLIRNNEFLVINKNIKVNKNDVEELEKQVRNLKNNITDINRKLLGYNDELEKIKVKVTDFDVYDLFKGGDGNVDLDAAKILIKNLENKINKKFGIYDDRNKALDKDMFKMKEDVKNALAIVDGMKNKADKNSQSLEELSQNFDNKIANFENIINEIERNIETINNKLNSKPDFTNVKKDFDKRLKDLEERLNSKFDLFLNKDTSETTNNEASQISKSEYLSLIKELRKRIGELEKFTSTNFEKINADDLKKRISKLESEIPKKAGKYELQELSEKVRNLDEYVKDLNFKQDSLQQFTEKVRMDLAQIIKKIEFLSGEYSKLAFNKNNDPDDDLNNMDMSKFLDLNTFAENKKDINNKFEKVRLGFEDLSREIEEILSKLTHTPTDKDFAEFQNIIKNLIDELKISNNKKYSDKIETSKSIKFLETQIKTLHDAFLKKNEAGDNWLLAKKPINNYVCASCEANIRGELDKRTEFVPWNRYPQRDDKAYRIGHGFSRMLQMVNEDIIKNAGEKGYSSDEDKKLNFKNNNNNINNNNNNTGEKNYPVNTSVKLPKVTRKKPILGGTAITEPNYNPTSPYDEAENENNFNKPQIVRVVRKNKGGFPQNDTSMRDNSMIDKNSDNINSNENEN